MEYYFQRYGDLELQRRMVSDRFRTEAFARALTSVVEDGARVLDVGTGTGILAMLAAKAGAGQVYGIDLAQITKTAANLAKANGLSEQVKILQGSATDLVLDEPVDLIVSEWLGNFAFVEAMLDDVVVARDKNLASDGVMMPSSVAAVLAPLDDPILYNSEGPGYWRRPVQGLDFSSLIDVEQKQGRTTQIRIDPGGLLAPGTEVVRLDMAKDDPNDRFCSGELEFEMVRDGVLNGFAGWFVADLAPDVILDTSPDEPETHWAQTYLAFEPRPVQKGEIVKVAFVMEPDPEERRYLLLTLTVGDTEQTYRLE